MCMVLCGVFIPFVHLQDTTSTRSTRYNIITNTTRKKKWIVPTCMQGLPALRFPCNTTGGCHKAMLYSNHVSFDA